MTEFAATEEQARPGFLAAVETEVFGAPRWHMNDTCNCHVCQQIKRHYESQVQKPITP